MKFTGYSLLLFLFLCSFGNTPEKLRCHKTFTPDQLQEDFNILVTTLQEAHPDLYRVNSRKHIDSCILSIRSELTTDKTYLEFLRLIAPLFTEIGDINTQWGHSPEYIAYRNANIPLFPLRFRIAHGSFAVIDSGAAPGLSIVELDGESVSNYMDKNYPLLPIDGKIQTVQWRWLETYFPQHHSNFWAQPDTFHLSVSSYATSDLTDAIAVASKAVSAAVNPSIGPSISLSDGMALLRIPRFAETESVSGNEFLEQVFQLIYDKKIDTLIVDVSGSANDGFAGMPYGKNLYSYFIDEPSTYVSQLRQDAGKVYTHDKHIKQHGAIAGNTVLGIVQPSPLAFHGTVYVIANGWTSNARGYFCAMMQQRGNTLFAGEECGACTFGMNSCALLLVLPNSDLRITIPTAQYITNGKNYNSLHGPPVYYPLEGTRDEVCVGLISILRKYETK